MIFEEFEWTHHHPQITFVLYYYSGYYVYIYENHDFAKIFMSRQDQKLRSVVRAKFLIFTLNFIVVHTDNKLSVINTRESCHKIYLKPLVLYQLSCKKTV